jgi:hypothetical protein
MATVTAILTFLDATKAVWLPIATGIVGWLFPSPLQKAANAAAATQAAEANAQKNPGEVTDLDKLP